MREPNTELTALDDYVTYRPFTFVDGFMILYVTLTHNFDLLRSFNHRRIDIRVICPTLRR